MGNTLAASGVSTTKLEMGEADVGSVQHTSLTSRMFRDPDSLKDGLQRKFICRLNTREESVKPSHLKETYQNLLHYSKAQNLWSYLVFAVKPHMSQLLNKMGPAVPRSSFQYCLLEDPSLQLQIAIHCSSPIFLCFTTQEKAATVLHAAGRA